jgi:hypothetical protein
VTVELYHDINGNGVLEMGEPLIDSQVTAGDGSFDFTDLPADDYLVTVIAPPGFVLTGGFDPHAVILATGEDYNDADFGFQQQDASIGDFIWNDLDGDGIQDGGEPGINGVSVDLYLDSKNNGMIDGGDLLVDAQLTAGDGDYDFSSLSAGDYLVTVTDSDAVLDGWILTGGSDPLAVTLAAGEDFNDADFGYLLWTFSDGFEPVAKN